MSQKLDHDKVNRIVLGKNGKTTRPYYFKRDYWQHTTTDQIAYIEKLARELRDGGVDCSYILDDPMLKWKLYNTDARSVIKSLAKLKFDSGIGSKNIKIYYNLVKDSNGVKYEYITNKWKAFPKGYILIGELKHEMVPKDEFYSWTIKERLREFVSQTG